MKSSTIAHIFRHAGLIHLADRLKFGLEYARHFSANRSFQHMHPDLALPPPYMLFESFQLDYQKYYDSGRASAAWLRELLSPFLGTWHDLDILDWGCGPARVLRHLPEVIGPDCRYYGADYNPETIAWCSRNLPGIRFDLNPLTPPGPYPEAQFDLIYGISVFTHLSEERHWQWLEELYRIARPGAVLLMTTQGSAFLPKMTTEEIKHFQAGRLIVRGKAREGHRVYSAFHPESWTHAFFGTRFDILHYRPGRPATWGIEQDVWVLRAKAD